MMKLFAVVAFVAFASVLAEDFTYAYKCVTGGSGSTPADCTATAVDEDSAKAIAYCHSPTAVVDNKYTEYDCGACEKDDKGADTAGCESCPMGSVSDKDIGCNTYAAPTFSFQCYEGENATDCDVAEAIACFGPAKAYNGEVTALTDGGCGTCAAARTAASDAFEVADCVDCSTALCNKSSAKVLVPFLAPLIAALFFF